MRESKQRRSKYADHSQSVKTGNEDNLFDLLENCAKPFLLILDGVEDPRNFGAVLRTAEAVGVHGIIIPLHHLRGLLQDKLVVTTSVVKK